MSSGSTNVSNALKIFDSDGQTYVENQQLSSFNQMSLNNINQRIAWRENYGQVPLD